MVLSSVVLIFKGVLNSVMFTQVEQTGTETAGSVVFRRFHGSSIPVNGFSDRIYPVPPGTYRNLSKPTAGYGYRIPASNSWHFPAVSCRKRRVSWGFLPEIHGILLQESSSWVGFSDVLILSVVPMVEWVMFAGIVELICSYILMLKIYWFHN